jgi:hypothetical protein
LKVLGLWANNGPKNLDKGGALARHIILKIYFPAKNLFMVQQNLFTSSSSSSFHKSNWKKNTKLFSIKFY